MNGLNQKQKTFYGINKPTFRPTGGAGDVNKNRELNDESKEEVLEFSKHSQNDILRQQKIQDDLEKRKRAKQVVLPTKDELIKLKCRELGEPIILFGERPEDRRERLKNLLLDRGMVDGYPLSERKKQEDRKNEYLNKEDFLVPGTEEMKQARLRIAHFSLEKAGQRIERQRAVHALEMEVVNHNKTEFETYQSRVIEEQQKRFKKDRDQGDVEMESADIPLPVFRRTMFEEELEAAIPLIQSYYPSSSQVGDERFLSAVVFSPDSQCLATGSWGGSLKLWDVSGVEITMGQVGHTQRINGLDWHPTKDLIASASSDNTCALWSRESAVPLATLSGHSGNVNRVAFHPMGDHVLTSSTDRTWRMWDLSRGDLVFEQEGHSEGLLGLSVQCDGSLVATGGLDALLRVWDLRSGKPVSHHQGHSKQIISIDWSSNGYQIATASEDHTVRIWDLRNPQKNFTILAHSSIVSSVKFQKSGVGCLVSGSFDHSLKIWSPTSDWRLIKTLESHSNKVTCIDISADNSKIVSTSFDKTWKIWGL